MKFSADNWVRENIRSLQSYSSARDEFEGTARIYLDANENPFGTELNRYPDQKQVEIKVLIGEELEIEPEQIFLGNGSDEAIDLLIRASCDPGKNRVISIAPSYGMYSVCSAIQGVDIDMVLLNEDFSLSADRVISLFRNNHKLLFLCSPNNPTGNLLDEDEIIKLVRAFNGVVVVDEAYIDFSDSQGLTGLLKKYRNLVLLRTFSKAWGLAGIRCGMALGHPEIIIYLSKIKYPYNLNVLTQRKIREVLNNPIYVYEMIGLIVKERKRMAGELQKIGGVLRVYPSEANFILIKLDEADYLYAELIKRGVVIRNRSSLELCSGCLRISIGTREENEFLLKDMQNILA